MKEVQNKVDEAKKLNDELKKELEGYDSETKEEFQGYEVKEEKPEKKKQKKKKTPKQIVKRIVIVDHHTTSNSGYFRNVGNWEKLSFWR